MKRTKPLTEAEALKKMAALCARSEHCVGEIEDKLRRLDVPADVIRRVVRRLQETSLVDEVRYSEAFARDKLRFSGWGRHKIALHLQQKRIPSDVCQAALEALDETEYFEVLRKLLRKKEGELDEPSDYQRQMKLVRFALGRGFSFQEVKTCLGNSDLEDFSC